MDVIFSSVNYAKRFIVLIPEMANFASNRMKLLVLVIEDIREV